MARILIVDDSPTETFRFREILTKHGYEVLEATNGADGVTMAQAELPDLVLMDVVMPGMNGFQATRQISKGKDSSLTDSSSASFLTYSDLSTAFLILCKVSSICRVMATLP